MLIDHWPLLGLRLITPRLELRLPSGEEFGDLADGQMVGQQEISARDFPGLREVSTFSWLSVRHHGSGRT